MAQPPSNPPWFVRKDLDGFFGLMIDNLIQLILIVGLCRELIRLPDSYIFGKILPGAAISILVGNFFYAWQARRLARETRPGRRHGAALRHQHRESVRLRFFHHAADRARDQRSGVGVEGGPGRLLSQRRDRNPRRVCRRRGAAGDAAGGVAVGFVRHRDYISSRWISLSKFLPSRWWRWCRWR